jgi:two-component sensor histidine kinase
MTAAAAEQQSFHHEVAARFGLVPNFFSTAKEAPELIERLWDFTKSAYLDNPLPSLSKERLFVYLSRFCEVRYCVARHCAFLLGYGHSSGDPHVAVHSIDQVLRLLRRTTPWQENLDDICRGLDELPAPMAWPEPETPAEWLLLSASTLLFTEPARAERARRSLGRVLGGRSFEYLVGLLAFIRTAHYWTLAHPEIELEDDILDLLRRNEDLHHALLNDREAARCDMGAGLFNELETLRALHEKRELEHVNRELQRRFEERDLLFKEANHRLKNSLQIVSTMLHLQVPLVQDRAAVQALHNTEARVMAIAAVHERLYKDDDIGTISLDAFLHGLCVEIAQAYGEVSDIEVEATPIMVARHQAVALALIINELVTNAFRHGELPCRVRLQMANPSSFSLIVSDAGSGPENGNGRAGLGSRIVRSLVEQIDGEMKTSVDSGGYHCELLVPCKTEQQLISGVEAAVLGQFS